MNFIDMQQGKHAKGKRGIFIYIAIGILLFLVIVFTVVVQYACYPAELEEVQVENELEEPIQAEPEEQFEIVDVSDIPDEIEGYSVVGKIVIEKIGIEKYILAETTNKTLNLGVTKFWGPDINEFGNYCITGHNYQNIFKELNKLEIGDVFYLIGKDGRKVEYGVTEIVPIVAVTDMSHIEQNEDNTRKVTLITCNVRCNYKVYRKS